MELPRSVERGVKFEKFPLEHPVSRGGRTAANSDSRDEMMDEPLLGSNAPSLASNLLFSLAPKGRREDDEEEDGSICETSDDDVAAESKISTVSAADFTKPMKGTARERAPFTSAAAGLAIRSSVRPSRQMDVVARFKRRHQEK